MEYYSNFVFARTANFRASLVFPRKELNPPFLRKVYEDCITHAARKYSKFPGEWPITYSDEMLNDGYNGEDRLKTVRIRANKVLEFSAMLFQQFRSRADLSHTFIFHTFDLLGLPTPMLLDRSSKTSHQTFTLNTSRL